MYYYSLLSLLALAVLGVIVLGCVINFLRKTRAERIEFIRTFKKGSCVIIYIVAIPLYFFGLLYEKQVAGKAPELLLTLFDSVRKSLSLVVLSYDISSVQSLADDNDLFRIAMYTCFVVVTLNAILFALSLFLQKLWVWFRKIGWYLSRKEKLLLVGNNEQNRQLYASEDKRATMIVGVLSDAEKTDLYAKKMRFIAKGKAHEEEIGEVCCDLLKKSLKSRRRRCVIVINTGDEERNIALCHSLLTVTSAFTETADTAAAADRLSRVRVYVFGDPEHETVYHGIEEASRSCLRYVNRHLQIAMDFIDRYPLTRFMTDKQLDTTTSLLRPEVDVNVVLVGFGKTNRQIFLTSVANNQLLTEEGGKPVLKQVKYHIFDRKQAGNNKNFNHGYARFENEMAAQIEAQKKDPQSSEYLPFPALPAVRLGDKPVDIHAPAFYEAVKDALSGEGSFNYIVIAMGTDLENLDMAQKLVEKKLEWGLSDTYVFVKVRNGAEAFPLFRRDDCYPIGDNKTAVYNMKTLDDGVITAMAKMRNRIYSLESEATENKATPDEALIREVYDQADCNWYIERENQKGRTRLERESNLYACLSLRPKLHMMGLDYRPVSEEGEALDEQTYLARYAGTDLPTYYEGIEADGKPIVKYDLDFPESRRRTMAIHEHYRWNSFMISKGFVPATREQILFGGKNGKSYDLRRHGNLTTFEGLLEFRRMVAERDGKSELETDVIKYDYQLLDDAYWLLTQNGYKIVEKTPAKKPEAK